MLGVHVRSGKPGEAFEFRVSLAPDEVAASFRDDERIEWSDQPPGTFARAGKQFQGWTVDASRIVIRHAVADTKLGPSPNVHIEWASDPRGGTLVHGVFRKRAVQKDDRFLRIATPIAGLLCIAIAITLDPSYILHSVCAVLAYVAVRKAASNRPTAQSMMNFGQGLWQLAGEKFVPHALGTGEANPFRAHALPGKTER